MIHQPWGQVGGQVSDIEIEMKEILKEKTRLNEILAKHTGQPLEQIEAETERDRYFTAQEAKEFGLVDEVLRKMADEKKSSPDAWPWSVGDSTDCRLCHATTPVRRHEFPHLSPTRLPMSHSGSRAGLENLPCPSYRTSWNAAAGKNASSTSTAGCSRTGSSSCKARWTTTAPT